MCCFCVAYFKHIFYIFLYAKAAPWPSIFYLCCKEEVFVFFTIYNFTNNRVGARSKNCFPSLFRIYYTLSCHNIWIWDMSLEDPGWGCCLCFAYFLPNFSLVLLIKSLLTKKSVYNVMLPYFGHMHAKNRNGKASVSLFLISNCLFYRQICW